MNKLKTILVGADFSDCSRSALEQAVRLARWNHARLQAWRTMTLLKKILVALVGGALLVAGLAMLVLPGPAVVVIPAALAILAVEFVWARRWLAWLRERYKKLSSNKPVSYRTLNTNKP